MLWNFIGIIREFVAPFEVHVLHVFRHLEVSS